MKSRNYKLTVSVGARANALTPLKTVLDTGAGPSLIREDALPVDLQAMRLRGVLPPWIVNASGKTLPAKGTVILMVQIGTLHVRVRFYVASGLAVPCILG